MWISMVLSAQPLVVAGHVEDRKRADRHSPERWAQDRALVNTGLLQIAVLLLAITMWITVIQLTVELGIQTSTSAPASSCDQSASNSN